MKQISTLIILALFAIQVKAQGTYGLNAGDVVKAGDVVTSVDNITLTYGGSGSTYTAAQANDDVAGFTAYTVGEGGNPKDASGVTYSIGKQNLPATGTYYVFNPMKDGTVTVGVCLNAEKPFYITEDGIALAAYSGMTVATKVYTTYSFSVAAGKTYYVFCTGSKLGFYGFTYTLGEYIENPKPTIDYPEGNGFAAYDAGTPLGWASVDGSTTGGNDENPVTVTTLAELQTAFANATSAYKADKNAKATIYIGGEIKTSAMINLQDVGNVTIYGLPGSALINENRDVKSSTGVLQIKRANNIILRNLTIKGAGAYDIDGNDNLTIDNCSHVWVDHCDFQDGIDGNFDCKNMSDYISVTWCRFRYLIAPKEGGSGGSNDHRFSDLWGSDDGVTSDVGHLNTTFANCWWDEGCVERMPRVRYGQIHIVNSLYSSTVASYCIGAGYDSNIYVENSVFASPAAKATPWKNAATSAGYTDYNITLVGNGNAADAQSGSGGKEYYVPTYDLQAYDAKFVVDALTNAETGAGATLDIVTNGISETLVDNSAAIATVEYYNANGVRFTAPQKGVNIVKTTYKNGTKATTKRIIR